MHPPAKALSGPTAPRSKDVVRGGLPKFLIGSEVLCDKAGYRKMECPTSLRKSGFIKVGYKGVIRGYNFDEEANMLMYSVHFYGTRHDMVFKAQASWLKLKTHADPSAAPQFAHNLDYEDDD